MNGKPYIFFFPYSRLFRSSSNGILYCYCEKSEDWIFEPSAINKGSLAEVKFKVSIEKSTKTVFEKYTLDYEFNQRSPRLALPYIITLPEGHLPSRSEAKKILAGSQGFNSIVMDFKGVESIGQGFADEVFRVFQSANPKVVIEVKNANEFVLRMIAHVKR